MVWTNQTVVWTNHGLVEGAVAAEARPDTQLTPAPEQDKYSVIQWWK